MPRGRLIFPLFAEIYRLDTQAMETEGRYDDEWRESIKVDSDDDGLGENIREEHDVVIIKAQIERDRDELQRMTRGGDIPDSSIGLVVHMRDLERDGQVNADGSLIFKKNGRLARLLDKRGRVVDTFEGMFCTHAMRLQADIGRTSNLALMIFADTREKGLT